MIGLAGCKRGASGNDGMADVRLASATEENRVEVKTLQRRDFPVQILSNGRISARKKASLSFRTSGTIVDLPVHNGSRVSAGAVLARLDRPDLDLSVESARIAVDRAQIDMLDFLAGQGYPASDTLTVPPEVMELARMRSGYRAAVNALSRAQYDAAGTVLRAPFSGVVADLAAKMYDVAPPEAFCTLIDDSALEVRFQVMEADFGKISRGMPVRVKPYAEGLAECAGTVTTVNPSVGQNSLVEVTGSLPGGKGFVDGMNVKVIVERNVPRCLVVPKTAVVIRDGMNVLFTYSDDGVAHWVYVNILEANSESYAVEANRDRGANLAEGDLVIVSGNLNLADGSRVVRK